MKFITRSALLSALLMISACATIVKGTSEEVRFVSDPPGATVETSLGLSCIAPCIMEIGRRDTFEATFTLDGRTETVFVDTEFGGAGLAGNLLLAGGLVGVGVDAVTGADFNHTPNPVVVEFARTRAKTRKTTPEPETAPVGPVPERVAAPSFPPVPGSPPLFEGSAYSAFTPEQIQAYCAQDWESRTNEIGRTEYNPCKRRDAFS